METMGLAKRKDKSDDFHNPVFENVCIILNFYLKLTHSFVIELFFSFKENGEINGSDLDDEELDSYIMTEKEAQQKSTMWHKVNEKYLDDQKSMMHLLQCKKFEFFNLTNYDVCRKRRKTPQG